MKASKGLRFALFTLLPLLYFWKGFNVIRQRFLVENHPYWADPDYAYLLNGQAFLNNQTIFHIDHPGTPVQIFNGLFQWLVWRLNILGTSNLLLEESVVERAETHQLAIALVLLLLQVSLIFLAALLASRYFSSCIGIFFQIFMLALCFPLMRHLIANKPEGFVLVFILGASCLLIYLWGTQNSLNSNVLPVVGFSLSLALALSSKISSVLVVCLLPLVLVSWRKIVNAYLGIIVFSLFVTQPIWPMLPTAVRFWTASSGAFSNPPSLVVNTFFPPRFFEIYALVVILGTIGVAFVLTFWKLRFLDRFEAVRNTSFLSSKQIDLKLRVFYAVAIVVILGQSMIATARNLPWIVPAIPIAALAGAFALSRILGVTTNLIPDRIARSRSVLAMAVALSVGAAAFFVSFPVEQSSPELDAIQDAETQWQSSDGLVVYDLSIAWSSLPYGGVCSALIFGDGFARQIVSPLLRERCPNHRVAIFENINELKGYGNGSASCESLKEEQSRGRPIAFLTPKDSSVPLFASTTPVAESRGWQFLSVEIDSCGRH